MHHYRQVLAHMRLGESDRSIARTGIMGRPKVTELRHIAVKNNWLNPDLPLPNDMDLARHLYPKKDDNLQPSPWSNPIVMRSSPGGRTAFRGPPFTPPWYENMTSRAAIPVSVAFWPN